MNSFYQFLSNLSSNHLIESKPSKILDAALSSKKKDKLIEVFLYRISNRLYEKYSIDTSFEFWKFINLAEYHKNYVKFFKYYYQEITETQILEIEECRLKKQVFFKTVDINGNDQYQQWQAGWYVMAELFFESAIAPVRLRPDHHASKINGGQGVPEWSSRINVSKDISLEDFFDTCSFDDKTNTNERINRCRKLHTDMSMAGGNFLIGKNIGEQDYFKSYCNNFKEYGVGEEECLKLFAELKHFCNENVQSCTTKENLKTLEECVNTFVEDRLKPFIQELNNA